MKKTEFDEDYYKDDGIEEIDNYPKRRKSNTSEAKIRRRITQDEVDDVELDSSFTSSSFPLLKNN